MHDFFSTFSIYFKTLKNLSEFYITLDAILHVCFVGNFEIFKAFM